MPHEDSKRINYRDALFCFAILLDDNNRKTICRLYLGATKKYLAMVDDNKKEIKHEINSLDEIYKYKEDSIKVIERLEKPVVQK